MPELIDLESQLIAALPEGISFAICGGYLRDKLFGREPSDIDVVVSREIAFEDVRLERFPGFVPEENEYEDNMVVGEYESPIEGCPYQILYRGDGQHTPEVQVRHHVCGLSNIFFCRDNLIVHRTFLNDWAERVIRVSPRHRGELTDGDYEYLRRMRGYFPGWRVDYVDPNNNARRARLPAFDPQRFNGAADALRRDVPEDDAPPPAPFRDDF